MDDHVREALKLLLRRQSAVPGELCPRCTAREQAPRSKRGYCTVCDAEIDVAQADKERARKRRYWHLKGKYKRRKDRKEKREHH